MSQPIVTVSAISPSTRRIATTLVLIYAIPTACSWCDPQHTTLVGSSKNYVANSSSSDFASFRPRVSNPSVNHHP
jgi:hypothetical protein